MRRLALVVLAAPLVAGCNLIVGSGDFATEADGFDAASIDGAAIDGAALDAAIPDAIPLDADPCVTPGTVFEVQRDCVAAGTPINLDNVQVTAIDRYGVRQDGLWVQDIGGGAYAGIYVFGVPNSDVAVLQIGDLVAITGAAKDEFALSADTSGRAETELVAVSGGEVDVVKVADGPTVEPTLVDGNALALMKPENAELEHEKWEGVLITMLNLRAAGPPSMLGSGSDPTLQHFSATGGFDVQSGLAAFPSGIAAQTCITRLTGIGGYFFGYTVYPRSTDEVALDGICF